jgi:tartronate-semialdehyde synthase
VLIDLPIDVQLAEIEFDIDTYEPCRLQATASSSAEGHRDAQRIRASAAGLRWRCDQRRCFRADGRVAEILNVPVIPTLMGWGTIPTTTPDGRHVRPADQPPLRQRQHAGSDFVFGIGNRWANRHTGSVEVYTKGRKFIHVDIEPTQIGRVFAPDYGIVSDAKAALEQFVAVAKEWKAAGKLKCRKAWVAECQGRKTACTCARPTSTTCR